jgi:hypothetical protein
VEVYDNVLEGICVVVDIVGKGSRRRWLRCVREVDVPKGSDRVAGANGSLAPIAEEMDVGGCEEGIISIIAKLAKQKERPVVEARENVCCASLE